MVPPSGVQKGVRTVRRPRGFHPGGTQGARFCLKKVCKWEKRRDKCRYRGWCRTGGARRHSTSDFS